MSRNTKQRVTLTDLKEPQQIRELNRQLTWIWDQLLGGLSMKSLNAGARKVIDSKADSEDVDALGNVVVQNSTSIVQTAEKIESTATRVETLDGRMEEAESRILQTPDEIRLAVEKLELGGRNYLRNTGTLKKADWGFDNSSISTSGIALGSVNENGEGGLDISCSGANVRWWLGHMPVTAGQQYTVSVRYRLNSGESPINFQYVYRDANYKEIVNPYYNSSATQKTRVENGWTVLYDTLTVPDDASVAYVRLALRVGADNTAYTVSYTYQRPKFESGGKATDWTPAPEDGDAAIAGLSAELLAQAGQITANATKIETVNQAAAGAQSAANAAQNTANAAQNAANGAQGTANNAVTRVMTAEGRISAVEGSISSMVTEEELNELGKKGSVAKVWAVVFSVIMGAIGILSWQNWYSIFVVLGLIINSYCMSFSNPQSIRKSILVTSPLVLIYDVLVLSIGGVVYESIAIISAVIGILRTKRKQA